MLTLYCLCRWTSVSDRHRYLELTSISSSENVLSPLPSSSASTRAFTYGLPREGITYDSYPIYNIKQ